MILRLGSHLKFGEAACSNRASGPHLFVFLLFFIVLLQYNKPYLFSSSICCRNYLTEENITTDRRIYRICPKRSVRYHDRGQTFSICEYHTVIFAYDNTNYIVGYEIPTLNGSRGITEPSAILFGTLHNREIL